MNTSDSMAIDQSLISTDDEATSWLLTDRPDIETVPCLHLVNYARKATNMQLCLTTATRACLHLSFAMLGLWRDARWLFVALIADVVCNAVGFRYLVRYPVIYRTDRNNYLVSAMAGEKAALLTRTLLSGLLFWSYYFEIREIGWIFVGLAVILSGATYLFGQSMAYTSNYSLIVLFTLSLMILKIHNDLDWSWSSIFLMQMIYSWVCVLAAVGYLTFWIIITIRKLFNGVNGSWASVKLNSMMCIVTFFEGIVVLVLEDFVHMANKANANNLAYAALTAAICQIIYLVISLLHCDSLAFDLSFDNDIIVKRGLEYTIRLVRVTSTSYIKLNPKEYKYIAGHSKFTHRVACFVCHEYESDCVIFNCMHSGMCQACAPAWLKINHLCPCCQIPIDKIAVITDLGKNSEYLVTAEMSRAE